MKTRFYIFLSLAFMLLTQTSCIYENASVAPECGSADTESLVINLNLTVPSAAIGTRSADDDLDLATKEESYIDVTNGDYQICVFDKDGTYVGDKLSVIDYKENGVSDGIISYTLTAQLNLSGNEDKKRLSNFKVMVLANWNSFEARNSYPSFTGYSLSGTSNNIYKDGTHFNFSYTAETNSSWGGELSIANSPTTASKAIPMFGVSDELDLQAVIDMAKYGDAPSFSVFLLRSLAKIEIVDMVPNSQSANIEKCVLTTYNTSGRYIPDIENDKNSEWNVLKKQIGAPSLPNNVSTAANLQFITTKKTVRTEGASADEEKDCFVAYIPEMELGSTERPVIQVQLKGQQTYTIELSGYENGQPKPGSEYTSILRNHIYRFNIISVGSSDIDFIVETPWREVKDDDWYYEDLKISFEQNKEFKWTNINSSSYPSFEEDEESGTGFEENGILTPQRTIVISQDYGVECTFQLKSPNKGTWTMALYGDDDTPNNQFRIDFKDENNWKDGSYTYSGNVGEEVTLRIVPVSTNNTSTHNVARVVLTCMSFDNQIIEVNLPYYHFEQYNVDGSEMPIPTVENNGYFYVKQYYSGFGESDPESL